MIGVYSSGKFEPRKFLWRHKEYVISQVTFRHDRKNGGRKQRMYSVESQGTVYRILFDRDTEEWMLEELWVE